MEIRGELILGSVLLRPDSQDAWRQIFDAAVTSQTRVWVAMATVRTTNPSTPIETNPMQGCFTAIATVLITLSEKTERMHITAWFAIPLELISMLAMAAAFGATLSLTLKIGAPELVTAPAPDLKTFAVLLPLSRAYAIVAGTGLFLILTTLMTSIVQSCNRVRDSKPCSFEPTASGLGMGHGYQATLPKQSRGPVPTLYDPDMELPDFEKQERSSSDEEKGLAGAGAEMGRRDSANADLADDKTISGPLGLQRPEDVAQMRPSRPWSEMSKRR